MTGMDVLTWIFRAAYVAGAIAAFSTAVIWHKRTEGAWRLRPAGVLIMTLILALGVAFGSVALRVLALAVKGYVPWLESVSLVLALAGVLTVIGVLFWFLRMVVTVQPDLSTGSAEKKERS